MGNGHSFPPLTDWKNPSCWAKVLRWCWGCSTRFKKREPPLKLLKWWSSCLKHIIRMTRLPKGWGECQVYWAVGKHFNRVLELSLHQKPCSTTQCTWSRWQDQFHQRTTKFHFQGIVIVMRLQKPYYRARFAGSGDLLKKAHKCFRIGARIFLVKRRIAWMEIEKP